MTTQSKRGGKRPGAGRKKGGPHGPQAVTLAKRQARERVIQAAGLTAARVLEEYRRLAFADTRAFFDEHGNAKAIKDLTAEQGSQLAGFEVLIKNAKAGDGVQDTIHKFRLWDKTRALEALAKHFGLLVERVEMQGDLQVRWQSPSER